MNDNRQQTDFALGALQSEHLRARKFVALAIVGIIFTLLLAFGCIALSLFATPSANPKDALAVYIVIGLCFILCGFFVWALLRQKNVRVQIYENGLAYTRGAKMQTFRWDEIESLWAKIVDNYVNGIRVRTAAYTLQKANGEKIILSHAIENIERIGERVNEETFRRIYPRNLQTIENGGSVAFGKFALTPKGIQNGKDFIGWQDVKEAETKEGIIRVLRRTGGKWGKVLYGNLPNAPVFLALVEVMKRAS